jgi:hypothetical protein
MEAGICEGDHSLPRDDFVSRLSPGWRPDDVPRPLKRALHEIAIIMAHEFGHILQYKAGLTPDGPWEMELHADFLAGWAVARQHGTIARMGNADPAAYLMVWETMRMMISSLGDTDYFAPRDHGTPRERENMMRAGYEARKLDVNEAFERGIQAVEALVVKEEGITGSPTAGLNILCGPSDHRPPSPFGISGYCRRP